MQHPWAPLMRLKDVKIVLQSREITLKEYKSLNLISCANMFCS